MLSWLAVATALAILLAFAAHRLGTIRAARRLQADLSAVQAELSRRLSELFSLQELAYVLSDSIRLDGIAEQVARYVKRFVRCEGALVAVAGDDQDGLEVLAAEGTLAPLRGSRVPEEQSGLVGVAMRRGHLEIAETRDGAAPILLGSTRVESAVVVPLKAHGVTIGAIAATRALNEPLSDEDLRLLSTAATHAAVTLANARFVELIRIGKQQWETTFDALSDGVAVVDESGRIRRANKALARMLGVPLTEVTGLGLTATLLGGSPEVSRFLEDVRAGRARAPLTRRGPDGGRVYRISASPMTGGAPADWVVALIEDVTEAKLLEAQLIQSEKMAAVGQLVSGVAHELNNPLTSIAGLSEFLVDHSDTGSKEREHLKVIHEQAERAARIVRDLLTFAHKGPEEVGDVDLNDATRRAASLIRHELRLRDVELELSLATDLPPAHGDRFQIQQVVLNLLTNAVHAVVGNPPDRPRRICVTTQHDDDRATLSVTDTGPGVPEELIPQVFDPFFTTKEPGQGTGLGLSIAFGIIEGHGGKMTVGRGPEGGARFIVSLPASGATASDRTRALRGESTGTRASGPTAPDIYRILLVDDEPAVRRTIDALMSRDGVEVVSAESAARALELLDQGEFALVLADARAAVSAELTLGEALADSHPELRDRTILLTADVRPEIQQWLEKTGWRYFRKPFNVRELQRAAAEIIGA